MLQVPVQRLEPLGRADVEPVALEQFDTDPILHRCRAQQRRQSEGAVLTRIEQ